MANAQNRLLFSRLTADPGSALNPNLGCLVNLLRVSRVPELSLGGLGGLRNEHLLASEPDGPALRRQSGPQPGGAVPAEVKLALPGHAVDGPDRRAAPVTCLVHVVTPAAMAPGPGDQWLHRGDRS